MATEQPDTLSSYMDRYPCIPEDNLQTLIDIGASPEQIERSNVTCKLTTDDELDSYKLSKIDDALYIDMDGGEHLTLAVSGQTGAGKSATANTIMGYERFVLGAGATSETQFEQVALCENNRVSITVIDTPGSWTPAKGQKPDVYVHVVNLASPRFGQDDLRKCRKLKGKSSILLLTHARSGLNGRTLSQYLDDIKGDPLYELVYSDLAGSRVLAINNHPLTEYEKDRQRENVIGLLLRTTKALKAPRKRAYGSGSTVPVDHTPDKSGDIFVISMIIVIVIIAIVVIACAFSRG